MAKEKEEIFTKYERARIIGARALQISMDAPLLIKISKEELESIRYNPIKIAETELDSDVLPITVKRPMPKKTGGKLKKEKKEEEEEKKIEKVDDKEAEKKEEKEIVEEGEIMELAQPEDEAEEVAEEEEGVE